MQTKKLLISGAIIGSAVLGYFLLKPKVSANVASQDALSAEIPSNNINNSSTVSNSALGLNGDQSAKFNVNSGYEVSPSGMITQFGYSTSNVKFPIAFPNKCISVVVSTDRNSAGAKGFNHATNVSKTGFTAIIDGTYAYYIAIGH